MKIRKANVEDIKEIIIIMQQIAHLHYEGRPDILKNKSKDQIEKNIMEAIEDKEREIIVAIDDTSKIYGLLIYKIKEVKEHINLKDTRILWIEELGVDENCRSKRNRNKINKRSGKSS